MQRGKGEVNCIKCGDEETFDHVFQCSSKEKWRQMMLEELKEKLAQENTEPALSLTMAEGVESCLRKSSPPDSPQSTVGWREFTVGFFHEKLIKSQWTAYNDPVRASTMAMKWTCTLRNWLWNKLREAWHKHIDYM
jgi:hypothetical protein